MDIKKEDPSKVIIVPRPPRQMNPELVPLEPVVKEAEAEAEAEIAEEAAEAEIAEEAACQPAPNAAVAGPGFGPMNNQVQGPAQGLAGLAKKK